MTAAMPALIGLQEIDDQILRERRLMTEAAADLAAARAGLTKAEDEVSDLRGLKAAEEVRHRELEAAVADLAVRKRKNEDRQ
jgi:predicted  nucleic acid-binding Zn-ribbon protein